MREIIFKANRTKIHLYFDKSIPDAKIEKFLADVNDEIQRRASAGHKAAFIVAVIVSAIVLTYLWLT